MYKSFLRRSVEDNGYCRSNVRTPELDDRLYNYSFYGQDSSNTLVCYMAERSITVIATVLTGIATLLPVIISINSVVVFVQRESTCSFIEPMPSFSTSKVFLYLTSFF